MKMALLPGCMIAALVVGVSPVSAAGGNWANAKKCQKDGWKNYVRSDLRTLFANQDDCVSYAAQGGRLVRIPTLASQPLCESYGGTFAPGPDLIGALPNPVLWVCNGQTVASAGFDFEQFLTDEIYPLGYDCLADGGFTVYVTVEFIGQGPGAVSITCYGPS